MRERVVFVAIARCREEACENETEEDMTMGFE